MASSSYLEQIESNLILAGVREYFDAIVSGKSVEHGKPAGCTAIMISDVLAPSEEIRKIADKIYDSLDGFTEEILEMKL